MPGSNFTQVVKGNATVKVDSSDYYVLVLANNGGNSPADVLYQFATYSANSTGEAPKVSHYCITAPGMTLYDGHSARVGWQVSRCLVERS